MKTLLLMRHAKASHDEAFADDFDRPLTSKGRKAAPRMGKQLVDEGLVPDRVLASSAVRTMETARAVAAECRFPGPVAALDSLYLAGPPAYVAALAHLPDEVIRPLVVGHNPGIEEFLAQLVGQGEHMSTGAVAVVELAVEHWAEIDATSRGKLRHVWRPRDVD